MEDLIRSETKTDSLMTVYSTDLKNNRLVCIIKHSSIMLGMKQESVSSK